MKIVYNAPQKYYAKYLQFGCEVCESWSHLLCWLTVDGYIFIASNALAVLFVTSLRLNVYVANICMSSMTLTGSIQQHQLVTEDGDGRKSEIFITRCVIKLMAI